MLKQVAKKTSRIVTPEEKKSPGFKSINGAGVQQHSPESIQTLRLCGRKWLSYDEVQRFNGKGLSDVEQSEAGLPKGHIHISSDSSPKEKRARAQPGNAAPHPETPNLRAGGRGRESFVSCHPQSISSGWKLGWCSPEGQSRLEHRVLPALIP